MTRRLAILPLALAATLASVGAAHATSSSPGVIAAYSLAAPTSTAASGLLARAVVPNGSPCPTLVITRGGATASLRMAVRPAPARTSPAFDSITVCERAVPVGSDTATVSGASIPAHMPARVERLALVGDTGCRIWPTQTQDCASPTAWPLARISASIAAEAPDAILINGDFFYRESACPESAQALCGSSPPPVTGLPMTDTAYGWIADALLPMAPMLQTAPVIVTRGNHEECGRAGNGYFLLMDPRVGTQDTCSPIASPAGLVAATTVPTPTYAIDLRVSATRTLRLAIVDSAGGSDTQVTSIAPAQRGAYVAAEALARPRAGRETWLFTHRPSYAFVTTQFAVPGRPFNPWSSMDQTNASFGLLGRYDLVFSSHLHLAQAVQLPNLPPQLVLGNGGTLVDPATGYPLPAAGPQLPDGRGYPAPAWAWVDDTFGYATATPGADAGSWQLRMRDMDGHAFARCGLADRRLYCR